MSALDSVPSFGFLKLVVEDADLRDFEPGTTKAKIVVSSENRRSNGRKVALMRTLPTVQNTVAPIWGEFIDLRCCPGWTIDIELLVFQKKKTPLRLKTDTMVVGSETGGMLVLYLNGKETTSTINVQIAYGPNHSDMYCLSRDCILDPYYPKLLTESLLQAASINIETKHRKGEPSSNFLNSLERSFQRLSASLKTNSLQSILAKHLQETIGDDVQSISSAQVNSSQLLATDHMTFPDEIETFRAIACARQFFRFVLKEFKLHCVPDPTTELVEKLLTLYMAAAQDILDERESLISTVQLNEVLTFGLFADFVLIASVWYLQHAFMYSNIQDECRISAVEINAVWIRFMIYDESLAGYIQSVDVFLLLQDMGETYLPEEIQAILNEIDSDGIGIVEFQSLIRWWCAG